jgi:CheY-like chemotaxis protein
MKASLLVAEDDEADVFLLRRSFREVDLQAEVAFVHDGQDAIEFLQRQCQAPDDRLPALLLLDLRMPRRNGLEVLHWVRTQPAVSSLPAILFSSSDRREDIERAYALGANAYMIKPPSVAERLVLARFIQDWLRVSQRPLASHEGFRSAQSAHRAHRFPDPAGL